MSQVAITKSAAHLVNADDIKSFEVLGPIIEYLTPPREGEPCVMRATIPPGIMVPLHTHADPETFLSLSGEVEELRETGEGFDWIPIRPGDIFHMPGRRNMPSATEQ